MANCIDILDECLSTIYKGIDGFRGKSFIRGIKSLQVIEFMFSSNDWANNAQVFAGNYSTYTVVFYYNTST